jgi:flagellar assembly protein FliH
MTQDTVSESPSSPTLPLGTILSKEAYEQALQRQRDAQRAALALLCEQARRELLLQLHDDMVEIATRCASRIVEEELKADPSRIRLIVGQALKQASADTITRVRVHPSAVAHLHDITLPIDPDPTLEVGDCVIVTTLGSVDARVQTKISRLREALAAVVPHFDTWAGEPSR